MIGAAAVIATPFAAGLAGAAYATVAPRCSFWGEVISRGAADTSKIALTFDDGPTPGTTEGVLDALRDIKAVATFFVVGVNAQRHPDLIRRIWGEGHQLANHSQHHAHFGVMRRFRYWDREVRATADLLDALVGPVPRLFRPPMGLKTWHTTRAARQNGHRLVTWSRRAMDGFRTSPERILARLSGASAGEFLLLHDGVEPHAPHADRTATIAAIRPLVEEMRARGLEPARLDQLI